MKTILINNRVESSPDASAQDGDLWLPSADYERMVGAKGGPVKASHRKGAMINVGALWREHQRPLVCDQAQDVWSLGASARERSEALESLQAPDFVLPDLDGKPHALSDYRGKKVFLTTWASW